MTTFFTTLSAQNWRDYGRYTIPTWEKLGEQLVVFVDGPARVAMSEFFENSPWAKPAFIGNNAINFHRDLTEEEKSVCYQSGEYNYRFDIGKFSWAIFAFIQALRTIETRSVWMDADVAVIQNKGLLKFILEKNSVSFLGRTEYPKEQPYTETGLLSFDINRDSRLQLAEAMEEPMRTGEIYCMPQWHDCIVFDEARKILSGQINFRSISRNEKTDHVFDETLGEWLHHFRGDRKILTAYGDRFMRWLMEEDKK